MVSLEHDRVNTHANDKEDQDSYPVGESVRHVLVHISAARDENDAEKREKHGPQLVTVLEAEGLTVHSGQNVTLKEQQPEGVDYKGRQSQRQHFV
jgi:hypothetical protein